jgi:hypothetical protein
MVIWFFDSAPLALMEGVFLKIRRAAKMPPLNSLPYQDKPCRAEPNHTLPRPDHKFTKIINTKFVPLTHGKGKEAEKK